MANPADIASVRSKTTRKSMKDFRSSSSYI
jgi:hypothetical protein